MTALTALSAAALAVVLPLPPSPLLCPDPPRPDLHGRCHSHHTSVSFSAPGATHISFCTICAAVSAAMPKVRLIWTPGQSVAISRQCWLVRILSVPTTFDRSAVARMLRSCASLTQRLSAALFGCATTPPCTFLLICQQGIDWLTKASPVQEFCARPEHAA